MPITSAKNIAMFKYKDLDQLKSLCGLSILFAEDSVRSVITCVNKENDILAIFLIRRKGSDSSANYNEHITVNGINKVTYYLTI